MWDLPHLVQLKKAKNALKKGRVDEAFAITKDESLREYRQCQDLLEQLASRLLERAREHFDADRLDEALADLTRAQEAGGRRPEISELRDEVLARRGAERRDRKQAESIAHSVRGHLDAGRLTAGAARLEEELTPGSDEDAAEKVVDPEVRRLERELKRRRFEADQACLQIGRLLDEGNPEAALESVGALTRNAAEEPQTQVILEKISAECEKAVSNAFDQGMISRASRLLRRLEALRARGFGYERWSEVLGECEKAGRSVASSDWSRARVYIGRLRRLLPSATWVAEAEEHASAAEAATRELAASPLGAFASQAGNDARGPETRATADARHVDSSPFSPAKESAPSGSATRPSAVSTAYPLVLWVDGAGSYLLVDSARLTIGRLGSSASPDLALRADLEGIHAEIVRVDHDHFVVAHGKTSVNGKNIERHLLQDGDKIGLDGKLELTFRQPTSLSSTAVLDLPRGQRLEHDVRRIVLQDGHVIIGATTACHVVTPHAPERTILSARNGEFTCRHANGVVVDGEEKGTSADIPIGAQIEAGELSFTITNVFRRGGVL